MPTEWLVRMPEAEYHADPCQVPSLSSSIAHVLDAESPAHAFALHPRLGGAKREQKQCYDLGSAFHAILLGRGRELARIEADDFRTKAAKAGRDAAHAEGRIPVLAGALDHAAKVAPLLARDIAAFGYELTGQSEMAAFWLEGGKVQCRAMMDHYIEAQDSAVIIDVKRTKSAHPDAIRRKIDAFGYDIQSAAYVSAIEHLRPHLAGRVSFVLLFCELGIAPQVVPVKLDGAYRHIGEMRWRRAVATWERCLRTRHWPGYASDTIEMSPPPWLQSRELEREVTAEPTREKPTAPMFEGEDDDDEIF